MPARDEAHYRLLLAEGFLGEAQQDLSLERWRSAVDNSQLATENAAKAVLATLAPVGRTHNPAVQLRQALAAGSFTEDVVPRVEELAECAELLGPDIHAKTDYGDEADGRTPWELFDEAAARSALELAERAVNRARDLVKRPGDDRT